VKVLVADDNAQNRYLLEQLLARNGHQCVAAASGTSALALIRAERFDAIVSDILMPGMDGFQLCREIKADPVLAGLPVIFYTATYTEPGDVELGLRLGASHYLIKPADPEVILATLQNLVAVPGSAAESAQDEIYLAQYNSRLVRKLESKSHELERANTDLLKTNLALSDEIGRRRAAEQTARAALELQRAALESTADGILAVDADGRIVAWNRRFAEIWRLVPDEGKPWHSFAQLFPRLCAQTVDPESCTLEWKTRAMEGKPDAFDLMSLSDGRTLERLSSPLRAPDGRAGSVWTFRDITERRQAEESQRLLQNQLFELQKMEALGVLAGGIAHDFNNILTAILGQTALAAGQLPAGHPVQEALATVARAGGRAAQLVRQILTFSRHQEPERQIIQPNAVVDEALKLMRSTLPAPVAIETDFASDVPAIKVDPTQIHQLLINLGTNASHAMNGRGLLRVSLRAVQAPGSGPPELRPGLYAMLSVSDNGPGIDPHLLRRIFEPFYTTKPPGQGTGLGLAVVHGIVKSYGGHITVRSDPGHGAEFQIFLPAATETGSASPAPSNGILRRGRGELVLLAEDDPGVREYIIALLERLGYLVDACTTAEDALDRFKNGRRDYAVVLTDLSLPGMSGSELGLQLRQIKPDLPVILMTGYFSSNELERDRVSVRFDLLLKPCSAETLSDTVYRAIGLKKS
jgi:signal transduction histidine kinase/DNA-binding response OmpR family regulator